MALKQGEHYRCTNPDCGCEIEVTKGAGPGGRDLSVRCCCGLEMEKGRNRRAKQASHDRD